MYDLHYNDRLRPVEKTSALVFGIAIDEALNDLLINKNFENCLNVFRKNFEWDQMKDVSWMNNDIQEFLLAGEDVDEEKKAWACLRVKGRMLLQEYNDVVLPLIEKVIEIQKDLENRPGVMDAILELKGHGKVLIDHKTSSRPYHPDKVKTDTQLSLYAADQNCVKAGFIVMVKEIQADTQKICKSCSFDGSNTRFKTCPNEINGSRCHGSWNETIKAKANIQLLIDEVPPTSKNLVKNSIAEVERAIKNGIYPENVKSCGLQYGKPCPYINYCWFNDKNGLEYTKKEKK